MNTVSTSALYPLFVEALRAIRENRAEYERECEEYARAGYRPRTCIHGTYLWTDYDPICGRCEDGSLPDTVEAYLMVRQDLRRQWYAHHYKNGFRDVVLDEIPEL